MGHLLAAVTNAAVTLFRFPIPLYEVSWGI